MPLVAIYHWRECWCVVSVTEAIVIWWRRLNDSWVD